MKKRSPVIAAFDNGIIAAFDNGIAEDTCHNNPQRCQCHAPRSLRHSPRRTQERFATPCEQFATRNRSLAALVEPKPTPDATWLFFIHGTLGNVKVPEQRV
ncbi:hypothetical protein [Novipirellula sp.]|uniref:hypothetical protein n=1 Tax=Novipirellula sp. TaxID=2795430 RepID=UPI0035678632